MNKILLGITGGIAAYKTAELIRLLKQNQCEVRVVMTQAAMQFVTPLSLQVLSQHTVRSELFDANAESEIDHIALARWADVVLIAPATANSLAKLAAGLADDLLSTVVLATTAPVLLAPAMNQAMWQHPSVVDNVARLQQFGYHVVGPEAGEQACGEVGMGRLTDLPHILAAVKSLLSSQSKQHRIGTTSPTDRLQGVEVLITAGATRERLDPVRYISNFSSGKMGFALANAAQSMGAKVTVIAGQCADLTLSHDICRVNVESADQMLAAVECYFAKRATAHPADAKVANQWFIATAAVADYKAVKVAEHKHKKRVDSAVLTLQLVENPDILRTVCVQRSQLVPHARLFCVGFAAETEKVLEHAGAKRLRKGADLICANDVANPNIGFNGEDNAITVLGDNFSQDFAQMPKTALAPLLLRCFTDYVAEHESPKD